MDEGQVFVKFGPRPTEEVPIEWASTMLTDLKRTDPKRFGDLLVRAIGAVKGA